jgi:hypothetical protein
MHEESSIKSDDGFSSRIASLEVPANREGASNGKSGLFLALGSGSLTIDGDCQTFLPAALLGSTPECPALFW